MSFSRRDVEADRLLERARHAQLNGEPDEAHWAAYRTYFEANPVSGVELGIGETGGGSLEIFNSLGKNVATVQCDKTNAGLILIKDQNGRAQLALPLK